MSYISYDFECSDAQCGQIFDTLVVRGSAEPVFCPECSSLSARIMSVPNVTRASFVDGTKRFDKIRQGLEAKREAAAKREEAKK